jgi:hypothetical protein
MTREQNFFQSFTSQLATYASWQNIPHYDEKRLPLGSFPVFSLDLGKTKYTTFDPTGKAISGEQDFIITVSFIMPHQYENPTGNHSDIVNVIEQFINNPVYAPPGIAFGDTCCINRAELVDGKALMIPYTDTRFQALVSGKYIFTIF